MSCTVSEQTHTKEELVRVLESSYLIRMYLQKLYLLPLQAYSHHMRFRLAAQIEQSPAKTAFSWLKLVTSTQHQIKISHEVNQLGYLPIMVVVSPLQHSLSVSS